MPYLRESIAISDADDDLMELIRAYNNLSSTILCVTGDGEAAVAAAAEGMARVERRGLANRGTDWFRLTYAEALMSVRALGRGRRDRRPGPDHGRQRPAPRPPQLAGRPAAHLAGPQRRGLGPHRARPTSCSRSGNPQTQAPLQACAALLHLAEGRYADARAEVARIPGAADDADMLLLYLVRAIVEAEAHLAGDTRRGRSARRPSRRRWPG